MSCALCAIGINACYNFFPNSLKVRLDDSTPLLDHKNSDLRWEKTSIFAGQRYKKLYQTRALFRFWNSGKFSLLRMGSMKTQKWFIFKTCNVWKISSPSPHTPSFENKSFLWVKKSPHHFPCYYVTTERVFQKDIRRGL